MDRELQNSGWGVTAQWMGSYSTVDGELQHSGLGSYSTGLGVIAQWMGSYSTVDGELQHSGWGVTAQWMGSYSSVDGELQHWIGSYSTVVNVPHL